MTPLLVSALVTVLSASTPPWCQPAFPADQREPIAAPSLTGFPGLFEVPAAADAGDESTTIDENNLRLLSRKGTTQQRNLFVGFGFLPRLTLMARGSWSLASKVPLRDLSASAQLLLWQGNTWTPSLAVGAQDFGGRHRVSYFVTRYVTASKTLFERVRLTAGIGQKGTYSLSGPFGGIEVAPCAWIAAIGENDGVRHNYGARFAPAALWGRDHRVTPTIDLLWRQNQGRVLSLGLRFLPANWQRAHAAEVPSTQAPRPAPPPAPEVETSAYDRATLTRPAMPATPATLSDALVKYGFENVTVSFVGDTVSVAYENRVFNREEWDALGVVFAEIARRAGDARTMRAMILRMDLPVMEVTSDIGAFRDFVSGALGSNAFANQLGVSYPAANRHRGQAANPSRLHLDATVLPRPETLVLSELTAGAVRANLWPEAVLQLGSGLSVTGRRNVVAYRSPRFPITIDDPNADQLLVHAAHVGLPWLSVPGLVSQVSVGRFSHYLIGESLETDLVLGDGRFSVGGIAAIMGAHPHDQFQRSVTVASVRYRYAPLDLETTVTGGQYLHGDVGETVDFARHFGLMEVGFFGQKTGFAKMAGFRLALPLAFTRDPKPGPVRLRTPGYTDFSLKTQILTFNAIRTDVAIPLDTGLGVEGTFRDRDRLNAVDLRGGVEALRQAALRLVRQ